MTNVTAHLGNVSFEREVVGTDGRILCHACAGNGYYTAESLHFEEADLRPCFVTRPVPPCKSEGLFSHIS